MTKSCACLALIFTQILLQVTIVIIVICVGAFEVDVSNWSPFAPNGFKEILTGATVVFFAYVGFDAVANSAEESKKPQVSNINLIDVFCCDMCWLWVSFEIFSMLIMSLHSIVSIYLFPFLSKIDNSAGFANWHLGKPSNMCCIIYWGLFSHHWDGTLQVAWWRCSFGWCFFIQGVEMCFCFDKHRCCGRTYNHPSGWSLCSGESVQTFFITDLPLLCPCW